MREHNLYLQPEKCEFEKTRIEYLSVIISHNKVGSGKDCRGSGMADTFK
jgi:hypothetical protein